MQAKDIFLHYVLYKSVSTYLVIFRAVTGGVIGGKTMAYPPVAYGLAFINLGLTFYMDAGKDYGTDPRGFIGWENETKTVFFAGVITKSAVSQPSRQRGCGGSSLFSRALVSLVFRFRISNIFTIFTIFTPRYNSLKTH